MVLPLYRHFLQTSSNTCKFFSFNFELNSKFILLYSLLSLIVTNSLSLNCKQNETGETIMRQAMY